MSNIANNPNQLEFLKNFVIFQTENGKINIDVFFQDETIWLTQKLIAELFEKGRSTITEHLKKIFADAELDENSVCRDFRHTAKDNKTYTTKYYNLKPQRKYDKFRVVQDLKIVCDIDMLINKTNEKELPKSKNN